MLGRMAGWEADRLTEGQLRRKQQLCEEVMTRSFITLFQVLAVIEVILVGESRMRGMMLYELHLPHVLLANRCRLHHFRHHQLFPECCKLVKEKGTTKKRSRPD